MGSWKPLTSGEGGRFMLLLREFFKGQGGGFEVLQIWTFILSAISEPWSGWNVSFVQ